MYRVSLIRTIKGLDSQVCSFLTCERDVSCQTSGLAQLILGDARVVAEVGLLDRRDGEHVPVAHSHSRPTLPVAQLQRALVPVHLECGWRYGSVYVHEYHTYSGYSI